MHGVPPVTAVRSCSQALSPQPQTPPCLDPCTPPPLPAITDGPSQTWALPTSVPTCLPLPTLSPRPALQTLVQLEHLPWPILETSHSAWSSYQQTRMAHLTLGG